MAARFSRLPDSALPAALEDVEKWPAGTARTLALALLHARLSPPGEVAVVEPEPDEFEHLAADLPTGTMTGGNWKFALGLWVESDPAAAKGALHKMPPGPHRTEAVAIAAAAMAATDPAGTLEFVIKSGEQDLGPGAAAAWLKLALQEPDAIEASTGVRLFDVLEQHTKALSPQQQDSLAAALASRVNTTGEGMTLTTPELTRVWKFAEELTPGPGRERLARAIGEQAPEALLGQADALWVTDGGGFTGIISEDPEAREAQHYAWENQAMTNPDYFLERMRPQASGAPVSGLENFRLDTAAPRILPNLCRHGHVAEAVELLGKVQSPEAWRTSFNAVLPYWMEADPAAARAAFASAPLTALERERWQQHPAFLLHP